ncbi:hypoxia-inducible factor 1 beta, partial [Clonorchis sinensis]
TGNTGVDGSYKPSFLSDQELKHLVLEAADGFLFVCQCDTGRIIYVSDSVTAVLNQTQSEWYQHTLYELCHPDDAEKICEQLTGNTMPAQGASIMGLTDRASNGSIKNCGPPATPHKPVTPPELKQGSTSNSDYSSSRLGVSQSYTSPNSIPSSMASSVCPTQLEQPTDPQMPHCLVALGRLQINNRPDAVDLSPRRSHEFVTRHSADMRITFCDQRIKNVLGLDTDEVLGQLFTDLMPSSKDKGSFQDIFDRAWKFKGEAFSLLILLQGQVSSEPVSVRCNLFAFSNPFNDEVEYIVCTTTSLKALQSGSSVPCGETALRGNVISSGSDSFSDAQADYETDPLTGHPRMILPFHPQQNQLLRSSTQYADSAIAEGGAYWRPPMESSNQFHPVFSSLSQPSPRDLLSRSHPSTFSSQPGSELTRDHPGPSDTGSIDNGSERILETANQACGTHLQTATDNFVPAVEYVVRGGVADREAVHQSLFYDTALTHPTENNVDPLNACQPSVLPGGCLIRASDSGMTRPSAICYLPSAPAGDSCGPDNTSLSPSRHLEYSSVTRPVATSDPYQPPGLDPSSRSSFYPRSPVPDSTTSSVFHNWYSSDFQPVHFPTSISSSSTTSDSYQQPLQTGLHASSVTAVSFNYPSANNTQHLHPQLLPIPSASNMAIENGLQSTPVQEPSSTYFEYFSCQQPVYTAQPTLSSTDEFRHLTSIHAATGDIS